jgi:ribosomal-protein-alanine N-acetyltransferase
VSYLAGELRKTNDARLFIEVAADNEAGRALYTREGFAETGRRKAYYEMPGGARQDAVVMMKVLT